MPSPPSFFFSHSRRDRDLALGPTAYLDKFYKDLNAVVAALDPLGSPVEVIGTIDRDVLQGENWDKALSKPLASKRALVIVLSPNFFTRENCGKELFGFLLRSPNLGIDTNGALTDALNVVPVQWYPKEAYTSSGESLIPAFLQLLNDRPAAGMNPRLQNAVNSYSTYGMEGCVESFPEYRDLLNAMALRIINMPDIPAANGVSFATLKDAFKYDWVGHFQRKGKDAQAAPAAEENVAQPRALSSLVMFYVTRQPVTASGRMVDFADQLILEPAANSTDAQGSSLAPLLADIRAACAAEQLGVFHAAANPVVPANSDALLARLSALWQQHVLTGLYVDPSIWPGSPGEPEHVAIDEVVRSQKWTGLVIVPQEPNAAGPRSISADRNLPRQILQLPAESGARFTTLRRALVDLRGTILAASTKTAPGAEPVPFLKGVSREPV